MEKQYLDQLEVMFEKFPAHTVIRCAAETLNNKAEGESEQVSRRIRQFANKLLKEANLFRYL